MPELHAKRRKKKKNLKLCLALDFFHTFQALPDFG